MDSLWYDLDEVQKLSRIFLAIFVLIGLIPFFRKSFERFAHYLSVLRRFRTQIIVPLNGDAHNAFMDPSQLSDMEYLVFTYLAQAGRKGLSLPALAQALHMDMSLIAKTLRALNTKGLVAITSGFAVLKRFTLSKKGRALALEKGLAPGVSAP